RHSFTAFEYCSFYKKWFKFYCAKFSIPCFYCRLTLVPNVHVVNLVVEKQEKRYFITWLVFIKIYVAGIVHSPHHILYTTRNFINALGSYCSICSMVESNIFVFFKTTFIYIPYKL